MSRKFAITTVDNPFDPFTQWDDWYAYDSQYYGSCEYLGRVAQTSLDLSDQLNEIETERAIDEICKLNPVLYKKLVKE